MKSNVILENITCNGCVRTIKESVSHISAIENIEVDIPTGKVSITHDDSISIDLMLEIWDGVGHPEA